MTGDALGNGLVCTCERESGDDPSCPLHLSAPSGSDMGEGVAHLRKLLLALAGRPDITRLFGFAERQIYEDARRVANAALSTPSSTLTPDADELAKALALADGQDFEAMEERCQAITDYERSTKKYWRRLATVALSATPAIRDRAFEEAAALAEKQYADSAWHDYYRQAGETIARLIRALKGTPPIEDGRVPGQASLVQSTTLDETP